MDEPIVMLDEGVMVNYAVIRLLIHKIVQGEEEARQTEDYVLIAADTTRLTGLIDNTVAAFDTRHNDISRESEMPELHAGFVICAYCGTVLDGDEDRVCRILDDVLLLDSNVDADQLGFDLTGLPL
jgi:hypothetical protein